MTEQKPTKVYHVTLTPEERAELERMTRVGTAAAAKLAKARVLLLADEAEGGPAWSDGRVVEALGVVEERRSAGSGSGSWRRGWRRRSPASRRPGRTPASWTAGARPTWSRWPARSRRRGGRGGRCSCWPTGWWPWGTPTRVSYETVRQTL